MENNFTVKHQNMLFSYTGKEGEPLRMSSLATKNVSPEGLSASPNFSLSLITDGTAPMEGCASLVSHHEGSKCTSFKQNKAGITAKYLCAGDKLEVTVKMSFIPGADAVRQINSVKNVSKEKVTLNHFGSALVNGVACGGLTKWYRDDARIKVHHFMSHWQGEAQWKTNSLSELGITKQTAHSWDMTSWRVRSIGSWSTGKHFPLVVVEDTETGLVWYMEIEGGFNWTIELGNRNGHADGEGTFFLEANAADEETGFVKTLRPGETFTAAPVLFGCTDGSFEEGVKQLLIARRKTTVAKWDGEAPACFNTYMDCVWGAGDKNTLPGLIDAAAEAGCEVFCLDAGWYEKGLGAWTLGDKEFGEKKFGKGGLKGIFDLIKSKGMKPGAWLEIESLDPNTPMADEGGVLKRFGAPVADSHFVDYTDPKQCEYIEGVFDMLYELGARFIKNDYNRSVMLGAEIRGSSVGEGLKKSAEAFYALIDRVKKKYPDLKIENCGSGAMRSDNGTLRHFELQSTSDQELYELNPSIASGYAACIAPEKAGIWAYPYPVSFYEIQKGLDVYADKSRMEALADGEQTAFNMINALCGVLYLSGRIDKADAFNKQLIKDGTEVYKKYRSHNHSSYPVWPCGRLNLCDKTHSALGFLSADGKKMTLAVWKFEDSSKVIKIDLSKYFGGKEVKVEYIYPTAIDAKFTYFANTSVLAVEMPKDYTARYFSIIVK